MNPLNPLSLESIKQFFKVRGEDGYIDWAQVAATAVQLALILLVLLSLYLMGVFG